MVGNLVVLDNPFVHFLVGVRLARLPLESNAGLDVEDVPQERPHEAVLVYADGAECLREV